MSCPKFEDFTRGCIAETKVYPVNLTEDILDFCNTDKFTECPFYKMLYSELKVCKYIKFCPAFENFQTGDFHAFVDMSNKYCTSENHTQCQRYILKEKGEEVPVNLHSNGSIVKEWGKL